uniref:Integrase core domain containing protein n=1 Tax=Solanum tuberosum TaxID=4113 RepID=M1DNQ2_SOLTU
MEHMMDVKVQVVNKRLDAFELIVLKRLASTTDVSYLRKDLDIHRAHHDKILVPPTYKPESTPTIPAVDMVLDALFREDLTQPKPTRARVTRPRSSRTSDANDDARVKKRERQQTKQSRKASILAEEMHQHRVLRVLLEPRVLCPPLRLLLL